MQKFRQRHLQLLVATDVAARGLDVNDLTHVINYGLLMIPKAIPTEADVPDAPERQVSLSLSSTYAKGERCAK